ncbi:MAG: glycosyltransferase family 39 protein [Chitinophagales bacterium]|nr:glycosyltransferase family 39 protein [Chitinophagales bacterium]
MIEKSKYNKFLTALVFILSLIPLFMLLDSWSVRKWDEVRNIVQAIEMYYNHNWLVPTFQVEPDMWNTKPPLLIWIQVFLFTLFKPSLFLARLPSALSGFLIFVVIYLFFKKYFKQPIIGLLAILFLISSPAIIRYHVTRTADYDALLTLLMLCYVLFFYLYYKTKANKYLYLFFLSLTLASLTKGIAALFFLPSIFIFCLMNSTILAILKNKAFYIGLCFFVFFAFGYYLLREQINEGYLKAIWNNELFGRFAVINEGHNGGFLYYAYYFVNNYFKSFYLFFIVSIPVLLSIKDKIEQKFYQYIILNIFMFFIIISISKTKIEWYDAPMYPLIAICCAACLSILLNKLNVLINIKGLSIGIVLAIFLIPYVNFNTSIFKTVKEQTDDYEQLNGYFLHKHYKKDAQYLNNIYIENLVHEYNADAYFYQYYLQHEKQIKINLFSHNDTSMVKENRKIATANEATKKYIEENYTYKAIDSLAQIKVYLIGNKIINK